MMRSPISLLYYDDRGRVIEYDDFVPPNRFRIGPDRADGVVELAPNRLETHDLSLKDTTLRFPGELCERLDRPDLIFKKSISKFP